MDYFYEQRPMFRAVQFDGTTESADDMQAHRIFLSGYSIRKDIGGELILEFKRDDQVVQVKLHQWVVVHTRKDQEPLFSVMDSNQFTWKYEPVPAGKRG